MAFFAGAAAFSLIDFTRQLLDRQAKERQLQMEMEIQKRVDEREQKCQVDKEERKLLVAKNEEKRLEAISQAQRQAYEQEQKRKADKRERRRLTAEDEKKKREAAEQAQKRADEQEQKRKADKQERKKLAAEDEAKKRKEEAQQAAEQESKKQDMLLERMNELFMQEKHAQMGRDRDMKKEFKQLKEQLKMDRQEDNRRQDMKFQALMRTMADAFKLFMNYYQSQRESMPLEYGMHHSRSQHQSLGYQQERLRLLANFDLPKDSDKDFQNIFNSCLLLEDNPDKQPNNPTGDMSISKLPEQLPNGFEDDVLSMVMTTMNDTQNPQVANLWALHQQVYGGSEDDMLRSNNGACAKEEGDAYFKEQEFEEAIECYSESIDELPTAAAYANRALAYMKLNKFYEAEYDCTDALEIDDRYFKAYARRAIARTKLGFNLVGALKDVQIALKLEPNNKDMKELCAQLMPLKGNLEGASEEAQEMEIRAQLRSSKAATEAKEEGNDYFKDQKFEDAIISYSVSITKSPTAAAYNNRAIAYMKLNKMMEAENDCTKAMKIDNQSFKAYARRAIAREKLGDNIKGALSDVEDALNLEPNNQEMKELHAKLIKIL